jgi:sugar lactone lactonase YvrE
MTDRRAWTRRRTRRCLAVLVTAAVGLACAPAASALTLTHGDIVLADNNGSQHVLVRVTPTSPGVATPFATLAGFTVRGIAVDGSGDVLVAGRGTLGGPGLEKILRVDPETGAVSSVTADGQFTLVQDVAVAPDGVIWATEGLSLGGKVVRVDPATGAQTVVATGGLLRTGVMNGPFGIAVAASGDVLVVNRNTVDRGVLRVDPDGFNDYTTVASGTPPFVVPLAVAEEPDGRIVVSDADTVAPAIHRIDPSTSPASVVNIAPGINPPLDVAVGDGGAIFAVTATVAATVRVDPVTLDRTTVLADPQIVSSVIAVADLNRPPVARDDGFRTRVDVPLSGDVLPNDDDPDGDTLTAELVQETSHGSVALLAGGAFTYTPEAGYRGGDAFTYRASDGAARSDPATVSIEVNGAPVPTDDVYSLVEGETLSVDAPGVLADDGDPEGDPLTVQSWTDLAGFAGAADGSFAYTPPAGVTGGTRVTYCVSDGVGDCVPGSASFVIAPADDPPVAVGDAYGGGQDSPLLVEAPGVLGNDSDADGDALTARVAGGPAHGAVSLAADGGFLYEPADGYVGPDAFTYVATGAGVDSAPATVAITVTAAPTTTPRIAVADATATEGDSPTRPRAITFTITLSQRSNAPVSVRWATVDGSAVSGSDYSAASGTATIPRRRLSVRVRLDVLGDRIAEPTEAFGVVLSSPSGAVFADPQAVGTIADDD